MPLTPDAREFLDRLMAAPAPAGFERPAQEVIRDYLVKNLPRQAGADIQIDRHDNLIATVRPGCNPHVAMLAHVDTVGLMVTRIDSRGVLHVAMVGRPKAESLIGKVVQVHAKAGPLPGVVFRLNDGEKKAEVADLAIDCGFADGAGAARLVRIGDYVTWAGAPGELADGRLAGPAFDDRAGVFVACQALLASAGDKRKRAPCVSFVSCIQEEGPTRLGAATTMGRLRPDLVVVLDTIGAGDLSGNNGIKLGGGPAIARGGSIHDRASDALLDLAEKMKLPFQIEPVSRESGTDLEAAIQFAGGQAVGCLISIPHRYTHSPAEVLDPKDLELTIRLLARFLANLPELF